MKTVIEMARDQGLPETEVVGVFIVNQDDLGRFAELVRADEREIQAEAFQQILAATRNATSADERGRMCEQLKECSSEKSTSNEANRSAVLGEGKQAN